MKLVDTFRDLLVNKPDDLPKTPMKDLFVFESGDLEKYPDAISFVDSHFDSTDLLRVINDFKQPYGFFRKKNSKADLDAQIDIEMRFPFDVIMRVFNLRHEIADLNRMKRNIIEIQEDLDKWKDIPEQDFLNKLVQEDY